MPTGNATMSLREAREQGVEEADAVCGRCGAPLGRYALGENGGLYGKVRRVHRSTARAGTRTTFVADAPTRTRQNRRTQPGIYWETFDGNDVEYYRVKCSCGNNEKRRRSDVEGLDVTVRDGIAVLVCW